MPRAGEYYVTSLQGLEVNLSTDGTSLSVTKDGGSAVSIGGGSTVTSRPGMYVPQDLPGSLANTGAASGAAHAVRFVPLKNITLTKVAFNLGGVDTVDNPIEIAVYNSSLTSKLATSGQVAVGTLSAGVKVVPVSGSLVAGTVYYLFICSPVVTTTFGIYKVSASAASTNAQLFGADIPDLEGFSVANGVGVMANDISGLARTPATAYNYVALRTD